jgi:hypothetical protein
MKTDKIKWPKMTPEEWAVLVAACEYHEAEETLERGFPKATCSGPERHWLAARLKAREALFKAAKELKRKHPAWRPFNAQDGGAHG